MTTLRIAAIEPQSPENDRALIEAVLPDGSRYAAESEFKFAPPASDFVDLVWYFERYLDHPEPPAPQRAQAIEEVLRARGVELFSLVFGNPSARAVWSAVKPFLPAATVEVVSRTGAGFAVQWEVLRECDADRPVSLTARNFVRVPQTVPEAGPGTVRPEGPLRVLLVVARPDGVADVPFRAVAEPLLLAVAGAPVVIDVLRPSSYARLTAMLTRAAASGRPYDILHFDGHGTYGAAGAGKSARGWLIFEERQAPGGRTMIDGRTLGELMAQTGVGILLLNACRSGFIDNRVARRGGPGAPKLAVGSFAEEALRGGAEQVLAMRYNLYVVTASQCVARLYLALAAGWPVGDALMQARRHLAAFPLRETGGTVLALQDWVVPALYRRPGFAEPPAPGVPPAALQAVESDGFVGRDETFFALDRLLDAVPLVVVWGMAGSGKSAVVRGFARWYATTGGIRSPAVIVELDETVASAWSGVCAGLLEPADPGALCIIDVVGVLSPAALAILRNGVAMLVSAGRRVIVTARSKSGWAGAPGAPISVNAMASADAIELARRLTNLQAKEVAPLTRFADGNPGVIALIAAALRQAGPVTAAALQSVLDRIFADCGPAMQPIRAEAARLRPALAALAPFDERLVAALAMFRGFVSGAALVTMATGPAEYGMPELGSNTDRIAALLAALVEAGLAQDLTYGRCRLHPLLPLVLAPLFDRVFPAGSVAEARVRLAQAGSLAVGMSAMIENYNADAPAVIESFRAWEPTLRPVWAMAVREGWLPILSSLLAARCMIAHETYDLDDLRAALDETAALLVDSATGGPRPGQLNGWHIWTSNRIRMLRRSGDLEGAERLARSTVALAQTAHAEVLALPDGALTAMQRAEIYQVAQDFYQLAVIAGDLRRDDADQVAAQAAALARRAGQEGLAAKVELLRRQINSRAAISAATPPPPPGPELSGVPKAWAYLQIGRFHLAQITALLDGPGDEAALRPAVHAEADQARRAFEQARAAFPEHLLANRAEAWLGLGHASMMMALYGQAEAEFEETIRLADRAAPGGEMAAGARGAMAACLRAHGRPDLAASYAASAASLYQAAGDFLRARGLREDFRIADPAPDP